MIMHSKIMLLMLLAVFGMGFSIPSEAAIARAYQNVYFDANNNIIGQDMVYCDNYAAYAGTVDIHNPNRMTMTFGCGNQQISCSSPVFNGAGWVPACTPLGADYGKSITYFHSATGKTQQDYCNAGLTGAFAMSTGCELPAPSMLTNLGPFYEGFPSN